MKLFSFTARSGMAGVISLLLLLCFSCTKMPKPDFSYAPTDNPEAGEVIQFMNNSTDATAYSWDFGDGTTSGVENPEHVYQQSGTYGVKLTATNEANEKSAIKSVVINDPTVLAFQVTESTGKYVIPGAEVLVYDNKADWDAVNDPQFQDITDEDGLVIFLNMEPISYYIYVYLEDTGGYWFYMGYTGAIDQNEINVYAAPCEWFTSKKAAFPDRSFMEGMESGVPMTRVTEQ